VSVGPLPLLAVLPQLSAGLMYCRPALFLLECSLHHQQRQLQQDLHYQQRQLQQDLHLLKVVARKHSF
jgi:hypothetical protein